MLKNVEIEKNLKKSERTKSHLMEVSLLAFEEVGFDQCTMRGLAKKAGVTAPAFYYYFSSKEEIVASYYQESLKRHLEEANHFIIEGNSLVENMFALIEARFKEFQGQRRTLRAFKKLAFDKSEPISPFHKDYKNIRKKSIGVFIELIDRSKLSWPEKTKKDLAQLLWLYHLFIVFYWIDDDSPKEKKTKEFLKQSLKHLSTGLNILRLPGAHRVIKPIFDTLKNAEILEEL